MNDHYDEYLADIHAAADKMDQSLSENMRLAMAASDWIFDKIHEYGGVAVFAHPFWHAGGKLNLPTPVREYILKQAKFDVMELPGLGGVSNRALDEDNVLCTAWWQEAYTVFERYRFIWIFGEIPRRLSVAQFYLHAEQRLWIAPQKVLCD